MRRREAAAALSALCWVTVLALGGGCDDTRETPDGDPDGLVLSGRTCQGAVEYSGAEDVEAQLHVDGAGAILGVVLADGELFDVEDVDAWASYGATHDVLMVLSFEAAEPATPHMVTAITDSFIAARDLGFVSFREHGSGEQVEIIDIDEDAQRIELGLSLPVYGSTPDYPPAGDFGDACQSGSLIGTLRSAYRTITE